ncbi:MAG: hypothetical protein JO015_12695 [Verrucomicrobia bacterium]|nr:hypothetical protein [Verrucomicrobiota bacterium]
MRILPGLLALVTTVSALAAPATTEPPTFHVRSQGGDRVYHFEIPAGRSSTGQPISQQQAMLAALQWAKGFYSATNVKVTSIQYQNGPNPYYLAELTGDTGGSSQILYAAVLPDGKIARPVAGPAPSERNVGGPAKKKGHKVDQHNA